MRRVAFALLLTLALAGCASVPDAGPVALAPRSPGAGPSPGAADREKAWDDVLREHLRRDQAWNWTIRTADARAVLVTPRLRKAFLEARPEFQGRFAERTERELVALGEPDPGVDVESRPRPASEEQVVFFLALYVTDQKNRDLSASYTIWNTTLERGDARTQPIQIETVQPSPAVMDILPFADRFDDLYLVRFPLVDAKGAPFLSPGGAPLVLHIESALADLRMEWSLVE